MEYKIKKIEATSNGLEVKVAYRMKPEDDFEYMNFTFSPEMLEDGQWKKIVEDQLQRIKKAQETSVEGLISEVGKIKKI